MSIRYYLDTSIWRDFIEDRDDAHFRKTTLAFGLLSKIIQENNRIIVSDVIVLELMAADYSRQEIDTFLNPLRAVLTFVEATKRQLRRAKDLAEKRNIPKGDVLHALIARDEHAILVTYDRHFQELLDIVRPMTPRMLI